MTSQTRRLARGEGVLAFARSQGKTNVVRAEGGHPIKFLIPRRRVDVPTVYLSSYGGGLLAGDQMHVDVHAAAGTHSVLTTQASTKVYKNPQGLPCGQTVRATVGPEAVFVLAPEPVSCYANSCYDQDQRFTIEEGGNLVTLDWMTSGRYEVGERFQFTHYRVRQSIHHQGRHLLEDAVRLDRREGPCEDRFRMGRFNCLATMIILGPRFRQLGEQLLERERQRQFSPRDTMLAVTHPLGDGVLIRVLSELTSEARALFEDRFEQIAPILGTDPWAGKF